jgi:DNA-binding NtrC family response regulator
MRPTDIARGRVLIIDDNDEVRAMLAAVVTSLGYAPIEADGGAAGIELAALAAPDAVCLDLWMEGIPGLEVLDHLQHLRPDLPVIIVTADPLTDMNGEARARGAFDYIVKPFEIAQVRRALLMAMTQTAGKAATGS